MTPTSPELHQLASTIRFLQGYRFLDRCGEALIQLEGVLDSGWIPGEASPKSGTLVNHELGMSVRFHSESMTVVQSEFLDFNLFLDQACKVYDVLRRTFEIAAINSPSLQAIWQKGFGEIKEAEDYLDSLGLVRVDDSTVSALGGERSALSFTVCTEASISWQEELVVQRRRLDVKTIMQETQPSFDDRLLKRARLLPTRQRDAMQALAKLRRKHPSHPTIAAQFDMENSFETEFNTDVFDLPRFLLDSWCWQGQAFRQLARIGDDSR